MWFVSSICQYASFAVHVDLCDKILKTHRHQRTDNYRCCIAVLDLEALRKIMPSAEAVVNTIYFSLFCTTLKIWKYLACIYFTRSAFYRPMFSARLTRKLPLLWWPCLYVLTRESLDQFLWHLLRRLCHSRRHQICSFWSAAIGNNTQVLVNRTTYYCTSVNKMVHDTGF
jgi:hypothetical protein